MAGVKKAYKNFMKKIRSLKLNANFGEIIKMNLE